MVLNAHLKNIGDFEIAPNGIASIRRTESVFSPRADLGAVLEVV